MADIKLSALPEILSLTGTDILPAVASSVTSKITLDNLAASLPTVSSATSATSAATATSASRAVSAASATSASYSVTSSYSSGAATASYINTAQTASYVITAQTASYVATSSWSNNSQTSSYVNTAQTASYVVTSQTSSYVATSSWSNNSTSASYAATASYTNVTVFPYSGSAQVTGSLGVTGSSRINGNVYQYQIGTYDGIHADRLYPVNMYMTYNANTLPGFPFFYAASSGYGNQSDGTHTWWYNDVNFGQNTATSKAGVLKFLRNTGTTPPNIEYQTLVSNGVNVADSSTTWGTSAGRDHTLTVTGSFLARDGVTIGTNIVNKHYITGSVSITGSITNNGFEILAKVSQSLNFVDDTAAATGGVPLGGLYRSGSFVLIRLV